MSFVSHTNVQRLSGVRHLSIFAVTIVTLGALSTLLLGQPQRPEQTGIVQGSIVRSGTGEPLSGVEVRLVDPASMKQLQEGLATVFGGPQASLSLDTLIQLAQQIGAFPQTALFGTADDAKLRAALTELQKAILTDNAGHFVFNDVPPGQYTVVAQREGLFGGTANRDSNASVIAEATVTAGRTTIANLSMIAGATISGRILSNGAPLVGVNVQAYALGYENGFQILRPMVSRATDDRGNYRLFYLPPGEYIVAVVPKQDPIRVTVQGAAPAGVSNPTGSEQPLRTFYPGTADAGSAVSVSVQGAIEVSGIDIAMQTAKTFRVLGEVRTTIPPEAFTRQPPALPGFAPRPPSPLGPTVTAQLAFAMHDPDLPDDQGGKDMGGAIPVIANGKPVTSRFEATGLLPGVYDWRAFVDHPTEDGTFTDGAIMTIDLRNSDVDNLQFEIHPIVRVTGVVTVDGRSPAETPVKLSLQVDGSSAKRGGFISIAARVVTAKKEDGSFMIPGIQNSRYRVMLASGLAKNLYLADVRQAAVSVFDPGFEVGKELPEPLQVILKSGAGLIEGVVRNAAKSPVAEATVALVPSPAFRDNRTRYQSATTDSKGHFNITNIIPGDYKLFAWPDAPGGAYFNAKFLLRYEDQGRTIHVDASSSASIDLTAIPQDGR